MSSLLSRKARPKVYLAFLSLWVGLTFVLTSIPNPDVALSLPFLDKFAHLSVYSVTGFLCALWRRESGRPSRAALLAALLFAAVVGAVDEIHQHWIPGRSAALSDWIADVVGGGAGAILTSAVTSRFPFLLTE